MVIVDAHVHIGHRDPRTSYMGTIPSTFTAEDMLEVMERNGVDRAIGMAMGKGREFTYLTDNEFISKAIKKYPDKIAGFARINPWHENAIQELEKAVNEWGFLGLKFHPESDSFRPNDDIAFPLVEKAAELKVPVAIHTHRPGYAQPALVGDLAARYPDVTFIMAHMGVFLYQDAIFVAKMCPNVVLETSAQPWIHRIARRIIDNIGPERLVWGSDCPAHFQEVEKLRMECAPLTEDEKRLVMGENILKITGWK